MIRILAIGDVMGKPGRQCLTAALARARSEYSPDVILCNGENAAGGFGLTKKIFEQFTTTFGIDCITMGNHWHDKREIMEFSDTAERLVLPANMMNTDDSRHGLRILRTRSGVSYAVMNFIGKTFMHADNRTPFPAADKVVSRIPDSVKIRIVDMHAEATSEKQALAHYLSGRVSLFYGTHSHVPTADERILDRKTGFVTDLGMTGGYDSVIGIRKDAAIRRFLTGEKKHFEPATQDLWFCAAVADVDPTTGHCFAIQRIQWRMNEQSMTDSAASETIQSSLLAGAPATG